ncbi:hypothetical protein FRC01_001790, partial [Tulasnella sp. 417]
MSRAAAWYTDTSREIESLVEPGRLVFDGQLLPELFGILTKGIDNRDSGQYATVAKGVWERSDTSVTDVCIKRVERIDRVDKDWLNT